MPSEIEVLRNVVQEAEVIAEEFLGGWEASEPAVRRFREILRNVPRPEVDETS